MRTCTGEGKLRIGTGGVQSSDLKLWRSCLCRSRSHATRKVTQGSRPFANSMQFIRQLPLQHDALDVGWTTLPPRRLPPRIHRLNANAGVMQPPPLAQSTPAAQSSTEQPVTRPLTTQDVPSILQAVLDAVNMRSTVDFTIFEKISTCRDSSRKRPE